MLELNLLCFDQCIELQADSIMLRTELCSRKMILKYVVLAGREGNEGRNCGGANFFMTQCSASRENMKHLNFASE